MTSYNRCAKCSEHKEKDLLCLNERCGKSKMFEKICVQCHRLQHRDSSQKVTEDDIDLVLGTIRGAAEGYLKQISVRILDRGMLDTITHLTTNITEIVEQLESIKSVFSKIVELSNNSQLEYQNIIKRIDSITARKDEDDHIARQLNIIKEKIYYNPEGRVTFVHEANKALIKQNSSSFTQHCKKSMEKINSTLQEIFNFDTLILDTFVKKKGGPNAEDLTGLEKPKPPALDSTEEQKVLEQNERDHIQTEIENLRNDTLGSVNTLISQMLCKPFAYDKFEDIKILNDSGIRIEKGLEIVKHVEEGEKNWEIASQIFMAHHQCQEQLQRLSLKLK